MPSYKAPVKDQLFTLYDVLNIEQYDYLPGYSEATRDLGSAILEESAKFVENETSPLNLSGDQEGCSRDSDGNVTVPKGFKEAFDLHSQGGWAGLTWGEEYGGQGMPNILGMAKAEQMSAANKAFTMYDGLSQGAMAAIHQVGTDEQKQKYIPNMVLGKWTGTMNLTEAHCGTDLGMIRTKAEPQTDGSYSITGSKIFISAGDHNMSENIIHLVLAKTPGAPNTSKGISLFVVPKININDDGSLGDRNGVVCGSLEEKMGIHGNSTCVMNYDNAKGFMLGDEFKGLAAMFIMMNHARVGVGLEGLSASEIAYQNAVIYANDRIQGRSLTGPKNPDAAADPIIVHPDVRRNLMNARSFNEPARVMALWCANMIDRSHFGKTTQEKQWADDIVGLMTPVMKGVFTDRGFENAVACQQVFGGHGYISEWGMEQFVRDARIAQIYEGTNGIQALDLVGRKLGANGGRATQTYFTYLGEELAKYGTDEKLNDFTGPLGAAVKDMQTAVMWFMQNGMKNPDNAGAGSVAFMHLVGHVALGHMWVWIADTCEKKLAEGTTDQDYYKAKLIAGRYYMNRRIIETKGLLAEIEAGCEDVMALDAALF